MTTLERRRTSELMDDPQLDPKLHDEALAGLATINRVSNTSASVWRALERLLRSRRLTSFSLLDVACGGGDLLAGIARRAAAAGFECQLTGWDISPQAISHAQRRTASVPNVTIDFVTHDIFSAPIEQRFNFVISTLFLHHLDDIQAVQLFKRMTTLAKHTLIVDDLLRSRLGYALAWAGCHLLSRSPIVHFDGPVSVKQAYTLAEVQTLARQAGLTNARFDRHWPCRFRMTWEQPPA